MPILLALTLLASSAADVSLPAKSTVPSPVFRAGLDGALALRGGSLTPIFRAGTSIAGIYGYTGFQFDGRSGGIGLGDPASLRLTKSLAVACWVKLESYASQGGESQIVFRGDDRIGLDPYSLRTLSDGRVAFTVENERGQSDLVAAPIRLQKWTHVLGSLDDRSGMMTLWIDGVKIEGHRTSVRPFGSLRPGAGGGISIGNVQTQGGYNQPFNGVIANLGIYDRAVTPDEIWFSSPNLNGPKQGFHSVEG